MATALNTLQPSLGLTQYILKSGVYPVRSDGSGLDGSPFGSILGSIHSFAGTFSPDGNPATDGGVVAIAQNTALFTLLGTNFGGNGTTTFQVPNLGAKLAGGDGGTGGTAGVGTQSGGPVSLLQSQLPASSGGTSAAVSDLQPTLTIKYGIAVTGARPSQSSQTGTDSIGTVLQFAGNFMPAGYLEADGRLLDTATYSDLFNLLGTRFGGDGTTTFALPDLRGKVIIGSTASAPLGTQLGGATDSITQANMPTNMGGSGTPIGSLQPSLALTYLVATSGIFPSQGGSGGQDDSSPFLGEIIAVAYDVFVPEGFARADGGLLSIQQNQALFAVLGTTYGGNGTTNFALPNLGGRAIIDTGTDQATGLSVQLGQVVGSDTYSITSANIPALNIPGTAGAEALFGGDANDTINGAGGNDTLVGNAGQDTLDGGAGNDSMDGGVGIDTASFASAGTGVFYGLLSQGVAFNTLGAGTDTLTNFENLLGSSFGDTLGGDTGANRLDGGDGDDTLYGWIGNDTLLGGLGNDVLDGGTGNDSMTGGGGDDTYVVDATGDVVVEASNGGFDIVFVTGSGWTASANLEAIYVTGSGTSVNGSGGADVLVANASLATTLQGGAGNDTLWGQGLADRLLGQAGDDVLRGGDGNDTLIGGTGNDQLVGGTGADTFTFDAPGWGYDQIFDFVVGTDILRMAGSGATSFGALTLYETGGGTVVQFGTNRIDLYGVTGLTGTDFLFV